MIARKQTPPTVLGIAFEDRRVHVALVRRSGSSFEVQKSFTIELSERPTQGDAQTLGDEIRKALQAQSVKEQRCAIALPVQWVLSLVTRIPELPEEDIQEFLNLEAERSFAYDPESLYASSSRCRFPSGEQYANIAGIQREQVMNLLNVLQAARLKPATLTVGLAAIQRAFLENAAPELMIVPAHAGVEIGITCGDGLFAMRSLENAPEGEDAGFEGIGRELRVTLGQMPAELRGRLVIARLFGETQRVTRLRAELAPRLRSMGLEAQVGAEQSGDAVGAVAVAAEYLLGKTPEFEFLPPKVSAWKQFAGKSSARKLGWAAAIAGVVLLLLILAFVVQGWKLSKLQDRWAAMSPRVTELEDMQGQIKKFRPWFDNSFRSLSILRKLTEAFPVDGVVTAKTLEIRNQSQVTCSGVARDNQALFKMLDQLRGTREVADVKMDQIRGKSPLQFNFNFRWVEGGTGEH